MTPDERKQRLDALYPVGEKRTDTVRSRSGRPLVDISLQNILSGELNIDDIGISADGLRTQAEIARLAGRETLARNFERAAELVTVPDGLLIEVYELLRPGRAKDAQIMRDMARRLRRDFDAERIADLIEEAAEVYERRDLFRKRF
jgi:propanediol dehydratase small subunit